MNQAKQTIVANPDFTGYVDQSPAALGLAICQRTIDPELFRVFAQEIRRGDDLSLTLTVIGASHLVNVEWENGCLSELLSCATESIPDPAMVLPVRGIVERDIEYKSPSFEYRFNLKLEWLSPNVKMLPDHVIPRCADQASASFPSRPGCPDAVTIVGADYYPNASMPQRQCSEPVSKDVLEIRSVHWYQSKNLAVVSQSRLTFARGS